MAWIIDFSGNYDDYLKSRGIAIDLQRAASPSRYFRVSSSGSSIPPCRHLPVILFLSTSVAS